MHECFRKGMLFLCLFLYIPVCVSMCLSLYVWMHRFVFFCVNGCMWLCVCVYLVVCVCFNSDSCFCKESPGYVLESEGLLHFSSVCSEYHLK